MNNGFEGSHPINGRNIDADQSLADSPVMPNNVTGLTSLALTIDVSVLINRRARCRLPAQARDELSSKRDDGLSNLFRYISNTENNGAYVQKNHNDNTANDDAYNLDRIKRSGIVRYSTELTVGWRFRIIARKIFWRCLFRALVRPIVHSAPTLKLIII